MRLIVYYRTQSSVVLNWIVFKLVKSSLQHILKFVMLKSKLFLQHFHFKGVQAQVRLFNH